MGLFNQPGSEKNYISVFFFNKFFSKNRLKKENALQAALNILLNLQPINVHLEKNYTAICVRLYCVYPC